MRKFFFFFYFIIIDCLVSNLSVWAHTHTHFIYFFRFSWSNI